MYAYCLNNPVMGYDPMGYRTFECCPYGNCGSCGSSMREDVPNTYSPYDLVNFPPDDDLYLIEVRTRTYYLDSYKAAEVQSLMERS